MSNPYDSLLVAGITSNSNMNLFYAGRARSVWRRAQHFSSLLIRRYQIWSIDGEEWMRNGMFEASLRRGQARRAEVEICMAKKTAHISSFFGGSLVSSEYTAKQSKNASVHLYILDTYVWRRAGHNCNRYRWYQHAWLTYFSEVFYSVLV